MIPPLKRNCICCDHLPDGAITRNEYGDPCYEGGWYRNTPYCEGCKVIHFGEEGCHWSIAPIPLEELV